VRARVSLEPLLPLLVVLATLLPGSRVEAGEAPVRVVTEQLPPFSYDEGGAVEGASTAVVRAVMDEAGLRPPFEVLPWPRAFDAAVNEKNTFIYSVARTPERESQLLWIGKICDRTLAAYCLAGREDLLGRPLSELNEATVAVIQGDAAAEVLRQLGVSEDRLHFLRDADSNLAAEHVLAGRSDLFVCNPHTFQWKVHGTSLEGRFERHSVIWEGDGYYLAANPSSDPELVVRVRKAFGDLSARGALRRIFECSLSALTLP
jgi:polar amino acid transport system substrate-binding protein